MSISWNNIFIKKQHNTTRVITLQTRTTHAPSTTNPETGGFLHKKLTATEETGDTRTESHTATATRFEFKTNKNTQRLHSTTRHSVGGSSASDQRTDTLKHQEREEETGAKDGTEQGLKGASTRRLGAVIADRDQGQQCFNIKRTKGRADSVLRRHFTQADLESQASPPSTKACSRHPNCGPPTTAVSLTPSRSQDRS
jgi:hypothetical protein